MLQPTRVRVAAPLALAATAAALAACRPAQKPATSPSPTPTAGGAPAGMPAGMPGGTPGGTPGAPGAGAAGANPLAAMLAGAAAGEPNPRPYGAVVTARAKSQPGLVTAHVIGSRLLFEIPKGQLGRDMLIVRSLRGTQTAPGGISGTTLAGSRLVRWERRDNRILLRGASYANVVSDTTNPVTRAVDIVRYAPIVAAFNVEAFGRDSAAVIDVTRLFVGGVSDLIEQPGPRPTPDPTRSFIETVKAFPANVEVEASQTFAPAPSLGGGGTPNPLAALFAAPTGTQLYHYSLVKLPDQPMMGRYYDERVGFFNTQYADFGTREQRVARRRFANRWRLECSDRREGNLCIPKKPITYYVDPATPTWLVPWIVKGIEEWQPAFEAAGFKRGIVARTVSPDSVGILQGENANVSMVRWLPSATENAVGPSTVDPRSGEILDADVQMYHNIMNLQRAWYFTQVGHLDARAQKFPMPDSLMGRLVQFVVAHEVGHTMALRHNMKGSSMYPLDSIRSRSWVEKMGHSPSIMDYARFNYVAQPEDRLPLESLVPKVGPYDKYAIMWGYTAIPGARTPDDEKATLDKWSRMQDTIPWYRYAGDEGLQGPDPGEANEAVGDQDAVRATTLGLKNLERVAKLLVPATTAVNGETYDDLEETYNRLVGQWATELGHVARIPGGAYKQEKVIGQRGAVYRPVEPARQRAAVRFLNENAFVTPTFLLVPEVLDRIEAQGSVDRIGAAQRRVLNTLMDNGRLQRMIEQEGMAAIGRTGDTYSLGEMLADLRKGIWSEAYSGEAIDPYRRRLQRTYIEAIESKINPPAAPQLNIPGLTLAAAPNAADARAMLRGELADLDRDLEKAVARTTDRTSRLHLLDARREIQRILDPESRRAASSAGSAGGR